MFPSRFLPLLLTLSIIAGCAQPEHQRPPLFPASVVPWADGLYHGNFTSADPAASALLVQFSLNESSRVFVNSSVDATWHSTKAVWILQQLHSFADDGYVERELGSTMALPSCTDDVPPGTTSLDSCSAKQDWAESQATRYGGLLPAGDYTILAAAFGADVTAMSVELWLNDTPLRLQVTETSTALEWGTSWASDSGTQSVELQVEGPSLLATRGARTGQLTAVTYSMPGETRQLIAEGRNWSVPGRDGLPPNTHVLVSPGAWNATVQLHLAPGEANAVLVGTLPWPSSPAGSAEPKALAH